MNNAQSERQFQWEQTLGSLSRLELRVKTLSSLASNLTGWFQQISGVVMIIVGVYMIIDGKLSMGGLIACYMLNGRASSTCRWVSSPALSPAISRRN